MTRRKERSRQLAIISISIALVLLVIIYMGSAIAFWQFATAEASVITPRTPTLPQQCEHLSRDPDPSTWDAETDSYPRNIAWENCMGVGPK